MIERVLEFASGQLHREDLDLRNVRIADLINNAVTGILPLAREGGFQIETTIQADLPNISGDESSLCRAVQNLLDNAMKYSGKSRWIGLEAHAYRGRKVNEVQITIRDKARGFLRMNFLTFSSPFFRGKAASSAQIPEVALDSALCRKLLKRTGAR